MKKKISLILLCGFMVLGLCGCGNNNATHERVELNDANISDYITVNLQGALTNYSYSSYSGVKFSGGISSSSSSYEFENVTFDLDLVVSKTNYAYTPSTIYNTFTKKVSLDKGGNYNILESNSLRDGQCDYVFNSISKSEANKVSYSYEIKNVSGSVVIPKKVIE